MRNPVLPSFILLILAAALYMLPDGALYGWRLSLQGAFARLHKPPDPRHDASLQTFSEQRDFLDVLQQKETVIADLNRRLRELEVVMENVERQKIVSARVVRLGPDNSLDSFTIDVGTRDGIEAGQAVVAGYALAGVVVRAEANAAMVVSLSSPSCYVSARMGEPGGSSERPRILGAVRGTGGGGVAAVVFSTTTAAKEGWVAMTSGLEKSIPADLIIGTVSSRLSEGEESGTLEAELRPAADLDSLDFVSVLARE